MRTFMEAERRMGLEIRRRVRGGIGICVLRVAAVCVAVVPCLTAVAAEEARRPHIVLFLTDDQSQLDLAPYGSEAIRTPHMQRLAEAGLMFSDAYVASPSCAPSRAALLTGLMPARNGSEANHSKPRADLKKWPAYFQELGYEVVAFGKVSHYKHTSDYGFDHFAHDTFHDHAGIPAAVRFLEERDPAGPRPLCLLVGSNWPHAPWPEKHDAYDPAALPLPAGSIDTPLTREWRARYAQAVTNADDELGLVYDAVQRTLGRETLFLFSSDHGAQWPRAKWNCYEAGVRVPLIVSWPGVIPPGTRSSAWVSWVDFLPTLLEAAGGVPPEDLDGRSFLAVLRGERDAHRERIFTTHSGDGWWNVYPSRSIRAGQWKLIWNLHPEFAFTSHTDLAGNRNAYFSTWEAAAEEDPAAAEIVARYHARPAVELYDLEADPDELENLAEQPEHAERVESLRVELEAWMDAQGDERTVFEEPRLLSDPSSYGTGAPPGNAGAARRAGR